MAETVTVARRFHGPPNSGNGGYSAGLFARLLGGVAAVSLRRPVPLDQPLEVIRQGGEVLRVEQSGRLVAEVARTALSLEVPPPPSLAAAAAAGATHQITATYAHCFVCGARRQPGDGLRVLSGRLPGSERYAAAWQPHPAYADQEGVVRPEFIAGALDCPGGAAVSGDSGRDYLLARFVVEQAAPCRADEPHVVLAWPLGHERRKAWCGTALFTATGALVARAHALWIEIGLLDSR